MSPIALAARGQIFTYTAGQLVYVIAVKPTEAYAKLFGKNVLLADKVYGIERQSSGALVVLMGDPKGAKVRCYFAEVASSQIRRLSINSVARIRGTMDRSSSRYSRGGITLRDCTVVGK